MRRILSLFFVFLSVCGFAQSSYTQKSNIPTIYIETFNKQSVTSKTTYIYATMIYVSGTDTVRYDSMQIRGRGNSTWGLVKKPYRIKFKESTKFLGKGYAKNKSWTLLANHGDKSLLRNAVTGQMGEFLGLPFNPAAHFVDLVMNGTYLGNYQVSDQVNVDSKRVEIFEQDYIATDVSDITGGYLLEIDGFATSEPQYFRTSKNLLVTIKSPDEDYINSTQKSYIKDHLNNFESLLFGNNFTDPTNGYRPMLDSATVIPWYIATELSANVDGFWSTYIYKEKNDPKIYFGPLWDYDIAYNNCNRSGDVTYASMVDAGFGDDLTKVWVKRFIKDPWFNKAVNDAWKKKIDEGLEDYLCNYIDSMAEVIDASQQLNYKRYTINARAYNEIYLYSTYSDYIDQLKSFIREHASYLTTLFASRYDATTDGGDGGDGGDDGDEPEVLRPFELNSSYYYRVYNKGTNMVLDVNTTTDGSKKVVMYSPVYGKDTQLWRIEKVGDFYRLINRAEEMAFNDPSALNSVGTPLNIADVNESDTRQLWDFVVVNENGNYNIINAYTYNAINNSGGSSSEGNNVISYYNNDRNTVSDNRQWRIVPEELIPDYIPDDVKDMLNTTIEEAETFLSSLNDWEIGDAPFCYDAAKIDVLSQMTADARDFESVVADDYILQNVNLIAQLVEARKVNIPSSTRKYVLKHNNSGMVLDLTTDMAGLQQYDKENDNQHFVVVQSELDNTVFLKSKNGLYLSLGTENSWYMYGYESMTTIARAGLEIKPMNGYYHIYTSNGLLGTTFLAADSKVYGDKQAASAYCDWVLEECESSVGDQLESKATELAAVLEDAIKLLEGIPASWIGEAPMQTNAENVDALNDLIDSVEGRVYATIEEYDEAISLLNEAMDNVSLLNKPNPDKLYYLRHSSGLNLSCVNGATLEDVINGDVEQCFQFVPVEGEKNCYHILNNGFYLSVYHLDSSMFMFSDTPFGENGCFVVTQIGNKNFTISSKAGYVGVDIVAKGRTVIPNAPNYNSVWSLVEATGGATGIDNCAYGQNVDYAVRYDKERQVVGFVSYDLQEFANVDVQIYTVGGRLLYTFKATQEQSLANVPSGTYIIKWSWAGKAHSVKFRKE